MHIPQLPTCPHKSHFTAQKTTYRVLSSLLHRFSIKSAISHSAPRHHPPLHSLPIYLQTNTSLSLSLSLSLLQHIEAINTSQTLGAKAISDQKKGKAIGIDLGTTYPCVGVWLHRVRIVPNEQGNRTTPSYVAFTDTERLVGDAKNQIAMNPGNTVFDAKRLIGRRFYDPSVQTDVKLWPFKWRGRPWPRREASYPCHLRGRR
ncbi:putative Heat shock protein 70 family [Dioscorea sansibarensis]